MKDLKFVRILAMLNGFSAMFLNMPRFINQSLVSFCQASTCYTFGRDSSLIFS